MTSRLDDQRIALDVVHGSFLNRRGGTQDFADHELPAARPRAFRDRIVRTLARMVMHASHSESSRILFPKPPLTMSVWKKQDAGGPRERWCARTGARST